MGFFIYLIQQQALLHDNEPGVHLALAFTGLALATVEGDQHTSSTIKTLGCVPFAGAATVAAAVVGVDENNRGLLIRRRMIRISVTLCAESTRGAHHR